MSNLQQPQMNGSVVTPTPAMAATTTTLIQLLQASVHYLKNGMIYHPIFYQTMNALHQHITAQIGLLGNNDSSKPAFYMNPQQLQQQGSQDGSPSKSSVGEDKKEEEDYTDDENDGVLAYGWLDVLSTPQDDDNDDVDDDDIIWKPILALLVQKDVTDNEACLWITREVVTSSSRSSTPKDTKQNTLQYLTPSELKTLQSIPMRRLYNCRYQNFYGDHRVILNVQHHHRGQKSVVFRCPTKYDALSWIQQLTEWKQRLNHDPNIELEMIDTCDSIETNLTEDSNNSQSKSSRPSHVHAHIVNDDLVRSASTEAAIQSPSNQPLTPKRIAEQLQAAEDMKRAQKKALEESERQLQQQEKQEEEEKTRKQRGEEEEEKEQASSSKATIPSAPWNDQTRVERELEARRRAEELRRQKLLEYEQEKIEREKKRREELELQRKLAREEQRKKDLQKKQKFLQTEEKKEKLKAQAPKAAAPVATFASIKTPSSTKAATPTAASKTTTTPATAYASPKPVSPSASMHKSPDVRANDTKVNSSPRTTSSSKSLKGEQNLWFSLDEQMSAFEAADAERRKAEEAKKKEEEEIRRARSGSG